MNMSLTDIDKIKKYVKEHSDDYRFATINNSAHSYYQTVENENNIIDYNFSDMQELSKLLKGLWDDRWNEELIRLCVIAAFRSRTNDKTIDDKRHDDYQVSDYVYMF